MEQQYRVYVVEDSPAILTVVTSSLESSGNIRVVGHADSFHGAISDFPHSDADAIVIDLSLRGGSGFDLLGWLGTEARYADLKKVVLTNYGNDVFRRRALSLGANYFFDKSLEFDQLIQLLEAFAAARGGPMREDSRG